MIVNRLVNYNAVVKVHIMAKLVCVLRNFRIAVANTDSSFMFTKPCGKSSIRLAIIPGGGGGGGYCHIWAI